LREGGARPARKAADLEKQVCATCYREILPQMRGIATCCRQLCPTCRGLARECPKPRPKAPGRDPTHAEAGGRVTRVAHTSRRFLSGCMRPSVCRCHHSILSMPKIEPSFQK
jgi:hypothetical protein